MPLAPGTNVGPYEILASVGAGGMGEVYRARDRKLDRDVAIKVLPAALSQDPERLTRFEREAKVLASLNHPNIAAIYGVEDRALVMELVEGSAPKGPLPFDEAWKIASQIVAALEYAHERGIIHRDLKPANVMITPEGVVKLLDFGLAKAFTNRPDTRTPTSEPENSPTLTIGATEVGVILGTAAYMPPEQAKGKTVDKRADIWAFGVVFYELLTGGRLFKGEDVSDTLALVLTKEPDLSNAPPQARKLLARCLEKDPRKRLRDIGEAPYLVDMGHDVRQADVGQASPAARPRHKAWLPWYIAAFVLLALMPANIIHFRESPPVDRPLIRLDVDLGSDVSLGAPAIGGSNVAISPDGMRLAYTSGSPPKLFTRRLDQSKATELPGTQGASIPFFSSDGQWIGFQTTGKLNKISVEGGAVVPLGDVSGAGVSWGEDGNIFMSVRGTGLVRIRDSGGPPETVAALAKGETALTSTQILPGGQAILFSAYTAPNPDAARIEVMTLADHHRKTVSRAGTSPRYVAPSSGIGYLVYLNKATLFAIPFDLDKLETRGTALPILDDVDFNATFGLAQLSVSHSGTLVYRRGSGDAGLVTVAWLASAGKTQPLLAKPGVYGRPSLSPDGQRLALEVTEGSSTDIWVYDWQRDTMTRLTFDGKAQMPVWAPDGRYIVFRSTGEGMFVTRSDGAGKAQPLTQSKNTQGPWSFTADGKRMAFQERDSKTGWDLWTVPIESDGAGLRAGKPDVFLQTPAQELDPTFSPDGRWLAYSSNESGTQQVYVRAFSDKGGPDKGRSQISNTGGIYPMWSRSDLFFESLDNHIMAAAYTVKGDSFGAGKPRLWSEKPLGGNAGNSKNLDLAPDGKRIVALMPATEAKESQESQNHVVFLLNFFDELHRRVPLK